MRIPLFALLAAFLLLSNAQAARKVEFDSNGTFLVDDKPFFPLGIVINDATSSTLSDCKSKGFNTVVAGGFNPSDLPAISRSGMMVTPIATDEWIRAAVNSPSLLTWIISSEPESRMIAASEESRIYTLVKLKDKNHPAGESHSTSEALATYKTGKDFTQTSVYPITMARDVPLKDVGVRMDEARKAENKPNWPVIASVQVAGNVQRGGGSLTIQPNGGSGVTYQGPPSVTGSTATAAPSAMLDPTNRNLAQPEPEEVRCQAYIALVHRASGLFFFAYSPDYPKTWTYTARLNAEIKKIEPWLVADGSEAKCAADNPGIELRAKKVSNGWMIIAVNTTTSPVDSTLQIDGLEDEKLTTMDGRPIQANSGMLRSRFASMEVKVAISGKPPTYSRPGAATQPATTRPATSPPTPPRPTLTAPRR